MALHASHIRSIFLTFATICWLTCEGLTPLYNGMLASNQKQYILPPLLYDDNSLEPYINASQVIAHNDQHMGHMKLKVNQLLTAWRTLDKFGTLPRGSMLKILQSHWFLPSESKREILYYIGSFTNHLFYWSTISPNPSTELRWPSGELNEEIKGRFGSVSAFKTNFTHTANSFIGSGFVWLCRGKDSGTLEVITTKDETSPITLDYHPILGLDLWEHAYMNQYQHRREEYVKNWWMVVDWDEVAKLDGWWKDPQSIKPPRPQEEHAEL